MMDISTAHTQGSSCYGYMNLVPGGVGHYSARGLEKLGAEAGTELGNLAK